MDSLISLFHSLVDILSSLLSFVVALVRVILPWLPLLAWIAFWGLAVNWVRAFEILRRGGFIGVLLLMFVAVLVWGAAAPPVDGTHTVFGLGVSNYAGKFIYVTMLTCIALLCGSVQMSGSFGSLARFDEGSEDAADSGH